MKKHSFIVLALGCIAMSCQEIDNNTPALNSKTNAEVTETKPKRAEETLIVGSIQTSQYRIILHRVFAYLPVVSEEETETVRAGKGYRYIYLDLSLENTADLSFNGGSLLTAIKIKDVAGNEYRKSTTALAAWCAQNPGIQNRDEYNALWETLPPGECHRAIVYAVDVPEGIHQFELHFAEANSKAHGNRIQFKI